MKPPHNDEEAGHKEKPGGDKKTAETIDTAQPRFRVSFAELQRMKMRKLQVKLVKNAVDMCETGSEPKDWEDNLSKYGKINTLQLIKIEILTKRYHSSSVKRL